MKPVVLIPYFGAVDPVHDAAVDALESHGVPVLKLYDCPYIDQARGLLATRALREGFEVMMFIDHDIRFEPDDVAELIYRVDREEHHVVGAPYSLKRAGGTMVGALLTPPAAIKFYAEGELYPAAWLGMGFTAIHRDVFAALAANMHPRHCGLEGEPAYPFFHTLLDELYWYGEDKSFCQRVLGAGMKLFLDTRVRVGHRGGYTFHLEDMARPSVEAKTLTFNLKG